MDIIIKHVNYFIRQKSKKKILNGKFIKNFENKQE